MDTRLMREFEELEGLSENIVEEQIDEKDDYDPNDKPTNASSLSTDELQSELNKRGLAISGFNSTDVEVLQRAFDEEFKANQEETKNKRREEKKRAAKQAGLLKRRMQMEQTLQEEQEELANNHQIGMMIELIKENMVDPTVRLDVNSISARSLAKAMWSNNTITCLNLSANNLNDHAGTYLARILRKNSMLQKIELDNNNLGPKTCESLGDSLKTNTSLKYLSLDSNPLCGSSAFSSSLSFSSSSSSSFQPSSAEISGVKSLFEALRVNRSLQSINLWRTGLPSSVGATLATAIEENDQILFLDIGHNDLNLSDVKRITDKLDLNLAAFETKERARRANILVEKEKQLELDRATEATRKELESKQWFHDRRDLRAETRRAAEEVRIAQMQKEAEERRIRMEEEREAARKAAEEAAAKKAKKAKAKAGKK